jgi:hypothetical protein
MAIGMLPADRVPCRGKCDACVMILNMAPTEPRFEVDGIRGVSIQLGELPDQ